MESKSNTSGGTGATISLDIPAQDSGIFKSQAVHDILSFLTRYHTDEFSITELTNAVDYSQPTITKAVDILAANDLVTDRRDGNTRLVQINPERLSRPDDPFLRIPQAEFHRPVRKAVDELVERLDTVIGIVLYGSVARGDADRRSDIDLWVLVEDDRMANQRTANRVRQDLEDQEFDTGRYAYEIDIESLPAVPNYTDELQDVLSDGLVVYDSEKFETVRKMVFHGDLDE
ncbi:nucleotidyltransferase [Halogeometricum borinquense]|uniref:Nucleotidyltransferase n=1 Tax=Halogeometricum borinquense (strain ATCC 700274 / DSM 11551 / JCM 10706 / KCTC 4070 / PR3) TaxID=469382 RepID=E4NSD3_HALBP|nr:nucleotidyltransferase domain-containing protein [Halogeometricum borinquense]ADQ66922.1 nucleotidyltransferase family protein [Halogeometricum borinquense DSM 11551]ELY30428.1 nucleotidyltransferase [Halogeometricum borinquense DSM 11551]QIQ76232.1 nucleotidyltransferase [Halogeometricum borinquense]